MSRLAPAFLRSGDMIPMMHRRTFLQLASAAAVQPSLPVRPNIVLILADDVGYGDLSCYGAKQVQTPNLDRLAKGGVRFTDAHSSSATCTPTRYSLLTGEYAWRKPGTAILQGDANLIIDPARACLPSILKSSGYATGAVGKWHLGLGNSPIDWNNEVKPGPREIGFDYSFIFPATGDRVPCVYMENQRVVGLDPNDPIRVDYKQKVGNEPTGRENPELLTKMKLNRGHDQTIVNGISRIGWMSGGQKARWVDEDIAKTFTGRAVSFIEKNARQNPFFLYFATHDIHVPRVPNAQFKGKTGCGTRCDAIAELDWSVGQIMDCLDRAKIAGETLFIFTSDNGPVLDDGYADRAVEDLNGHTPAGQFRGGKYSLYEAGTRMPFIARWPNRIKPGASDALIGQVDLTASLASLAGQPVPQGAAPDSQDVLPALLGESKKGRESLVEHANALALRKGKWKLIPRRPEHLKQPNEANGLDVDQLFDLSGDPGEKNNIASANATIVRDMASQLKAIAGNLPREAPVPLARLRKLP